MGSLGSLIIGLIVGWFAAKLLSSSKSTAQPTAITTTPASPPAPVEAAPAPASPSPAAATTVAAAASAATAGATSAAADSGLADALSSARAKADELQSEVARLQREADAAKRRLLAADHQAGNHASTISALRRDVASAIGRAEAAERELASKSA